MMSLCVYQRNEVYVEKRFYIIFVNDHCMHAIFYTGIIAHMYRLLYLESNQYSVIPVNLFLSTCIHEPHNDMLVNLNYKLSSTP